MIKIFNTQLNGIFSKIENQEEDIEIASQLLMQAIVGEGSIYVKCFDDLQFFNDYMIHSKEKLPSAKNLKSINEIDQTDRVLLVAPFFNEDILEWINKLTEHDIDFVVIANKSKEHKTHETLMHFIDLSTPRAIVPTADYSKIITPHVMALNYIYYIMYSEIYEMNQDF